MLFESRDKIKSVLSGKSILSRGEDSFLISSELGICIGNRSNKRIWVMYPFFKFLRCSDCNIKRSKILIFFPAFNRFVFFSKVVVGLVLKIDADSLAVHRVRFLLDPEWRASLFAKKYLKSVDFISIKQIFSRFDDDIVCVIFGYNYFWSGKKTRRKVWFLLLFFSSDGLLFLKFLTQMMLRKVGSSDDAEACEELEGYLEIFLHREKRNKNLLQYNKVQCLCKYFLLVFWK